MSEAFIVRGLIIMNRKIKSILFTIISSLLIVIFELIDAKVSIDEVKKLGKEDTLLTPLGAERSGNDNKTIPEWTGGVTSYPSDYKPGEFYILPFPQDKIQFTITSNNYTKYKDKLTNGMIAMFESYPDSFKMNIYKSHRTASYPEYVYDALLENAKNAELVKGGNGILKAKITSPFPIPNSGLEAVWNHVLHYRGQTFVRDYAQASPTLTGDYTLIKIIEKSYVPYAKNNVSLDEIKNNNIFAYFIQVIKSPPRLSGTALLIHESIDQVKKPRSSWRYNPGLRRVRRSPNVAYDYPGTASDGLRTTDDWNIFNGSPDRYIWELFDKQEKYIPYNCYKLGSNKVRYKDIIKPGHINQKFVRYELHRVWVIKATLKKGYRHIYKKRILYLDEDSWFCVSSDMYDTRNTLWRVTISHPINYYELPTVWSVLDVYHDLFARRYLASNLNNESRVIDFSKKFTKKDFTTSALRRIGLR